MFVVSFCIGASCPELIFFVTFIRFIFCINSLTGFVASLVYRFCEEVRFCMMLGSCNEAFGWNLRFCYDEATG